MRPCLLDVNVLIALGWPAHVHHALCQTWFGENRRAGFATCPLTQTGFVRISSNPAFSPAARPPMEAVDLLRRIVALPEHRFWPDDLSFPDAVMPGQLLAGHRQVVDAYLIALARAHGGRLATLDRAVMAMDPGGECVELISH